MTAILMLAVTGTHGLNERPLYGFASRERVQPLSQCRFHHVALVIRDNNIVKISAITTNDAQIFFPVILIIWLVIDFITRNF